ncbi:MAG: DUF5362 family protein [candidate division WOR-3 bacterium]
MESSVTTAVSDSPVRENIRGMKGWLKFLGIVQIVIGILQALTIFGIFWAWLPIWLGVILNSASTKAEDYVEKGDQEGLAAFISKLKLFFIINGIMMIISLAGVAILLIMVSVFAALGIFSLPSFLTELLNR